MLSLLTTAPARAPSALAAADAAPPANRPDTDDAGGFAQALQRSSNAMQAPADDTASAAPAPARDAPPTTTERSAGPAEAGSPTPPEAGSAVTDEVDCTLHHPAAAADAAGETTRATPWQRTARAAAGTNTGTSTAASARHRASRETANSESADTESADATDASTRAARDETTDAGEPAAAAIASAPGASATATNNLAAPASTVALAAAGPAADAAAANAAAPATASTTAPAVLGPDIGRTAANAVRGAVAATSVRPGQGGAPSRSTLALAESGRASAGAAAAPATAGPRLAEPGAAPVADGGEAAADPSDAARTPPTTAGRTNVEAAPAPLAPRDATATGSDLTVAADTGIPPTATADASGSSPRAATGRRPTANPEARAPGADPAGAAAAGLLARREAAAGSAASRGEAPPVGTERPSARPAAAAGATSRTADMAAARAEASDAASRLAGPGGQAGREQGSSDGQPRGDALVMGAANAAAAPDASSGAAPRFGDQLQALMPATGTQPHTSHPTATARIAVPMQAPDFAPALGSQVTMFARDGVQHARIDLNPAEMGPISVQIAIDGSTAKVDFHAEAALTRQAIENSLPSLAGALRDAGLTLTGGGVFQQSSGQPNGQPNGPNAGQSGNGGRGQRDLADVEGTSAGATVLRPAARRGLVDLVA